MKSDNRNVCIFPSEGSKTEREYYLWLKSSFGILGNESVERRQIGHEEVARLRR